MGFVIKLFWTKTIKLLINKKIDKAEHPAEVEHIKQLCEKYQVHFVINDDLKLAAQFGLCVHLGQSDGEITDAKSQLPEGVIIGSCINRAKGNISCAIGNCFLSKL